MRAHLGRQNLEVAGDAGSNMLRLGTLDGSVYDLGGVCIFSIRDGIATISTGGSVALALNGLANDNFGNEASFEAIYGANAVGYVI